MNISDISSIRKIDVNHATDLMSDNPVEAQYPMKGETFSFSEDVIEGLDLSLKLGVEDINFSLKDLKALDRLNQEINQILQIEGLSRLTNAQEKELDIADEQIMRFFDKVGDKPLTKTQAKQLDALYTKEEKILGIKALNLSEADEKRLEKLESRIEHIFANVLKNLNV